MSLLDVGLGVQEPSFRTGPRVDPNDSRADDAVWLAKRVGLELDPWQELVLRTGRARRADGKWVAFEVAPIVPRQNGKGSILEALEIDALFNDEEARLILHSAHEFKTAYEAFRRVVGLIQDSELMPLVRRIRYTTGEEGIELEDGSRLKFVARSTGAGRGFSGDLIVLDEAYNLTDAAMSAMLPTLSARPNPQIWYTSSAPLPNDKSDVLRRLIRRGRAGASSRLAFFEWAANKGDAIDDRDAWARANPGLGIRLNEDVIEAELGAMTVEDFARERLGLWPDEEDVQKGIIPPERWAACERERSEPVGETVLAVDVAPNRDWASIVWAARSNQRGVHVEVLEHRRGVRWLIPTLVEYQERTGSKVAIGVNSPAWSLKEDLDEARVGLRELSKAELAQASGALFDAVMEDDLAHLGQPALNDAVANAKKVNYDDAWLWSRRTSEIDISPLVAVTMAHWLVKQRQRKPGLL
jgi:phage terminase large subunit-like protein